MPQVLKKSLGFTFVFFTFALMQAGPLAFASVGKNPVKSGPKDAPEILTKIAVGPKAPKPTPEPAPQMDSGSDEDAADAVDQPLPKAVIQTSDAPGTKVEDLRALKATDSPPSSEETAGEPAPAHHEAAPPAAEHPAPIEKAKVAKPVGPKGTNTVTAEQSMKWLINGNTRFTSKKFRADGKSASDRMRTSKEQKPHAIVLACSESVSPPELIFDQGIGEITTIRVAGPALDKTVIASLEQAVEKYDSHLIVVLGHTQCSALDESPYIKNRESKASRNLEVESALNADGIARDLTERSEILKTRVESGQLVIKSGLYWVDTGKVKFY